jgi:hypothetical protein
MVQKMAKIKMTPELTEIRLGICPSKYQCKLDDVRRFVMLEIGR